MTELGHDPAFDDLYRYFCFGFVLGFIWTCRHDDTLVMGSQLLIAGVDVRLITMGFADRTFQVIRHHELRYTAEELKGLHMRIEPVSLLLAPAGAGKGIVRRTEYRNKDLCLAELSCVRIDDGHRRAAVIHKQLFTGAMNLPHAALLAPQPNLVAMTELGITVAIIRMALTILLPQQQFGHTFTFQFLADRRKVRFRKAALPGGCLGWKQQTPQVTFEHAFRKRPAKSCLFGAVQVIHHRAIANIQGIGDASIGQSGFVSKPQNVFDFTH